MPTELTDVQIANEQVSITRACRMIGMNLPDFDYGSVKLYCPFGELYHSDEGRSKAFRVYPNTNSAYCFAGCGAFTPVKLMATEMDVSLEQAAEILLERIGYVAPTIDARWAALVNSKPVVDQDALAEALKTFCARIDPTFEDSQFDPKTSKALRLCLELLPKVGTEEEATLWLTKTKLVMRKTIGAPPS